jgi:hypothetical protein
MSYGRGVGQAFLGALGANIVNDLITGGFHRHSQFEYPNAYQQSAYNPGLNPALFYGGRPNGLDYTQAYLPQNQMFYGQGGQNWGQTQRWGQPQYPWGQPQGYDPRQQQGLDRNPNPMGLSEYDEGNWAADRTLQGRNLCTSVQTIHDMEVMDAMTRRHGFPSHYARDMFNLEKMRLRNQGYDLRYHQCPDGQSREFAIFDRAGNLVDKMRIAKFNQNEVPNDDIRPLTA